MHLLRLFPTSAVGHSRQRRLGPIGLAVAFGAAFGTASAESPDPLPMTGAGADTAAVAAPARPETAFGREIAMALAEEGGRVADLQVRFDAAADEVAALAIQREIESVKAATEVAILGIQERHARAAGRAEEADRILAAMTQLTTPMPVGRPMPRPAPSTGHEAGTR